MAVWRLSGDTRDTYEDLEVSSLLCLSYLCPSKVETCPWFHDSYGNYQVLIGKDRKEHRELSLLTKLELDRNHNSTKTNERALWAAILLHSRSSVQAILATGKQKCVPCVASKTSGCRSSI